MRLVLLTLLFLLNILFIHGCSIVGLTTGIIIDLTSYRDQTVNADSLNALTSDDFLRIYLIDGNTHYGKFKQIMTLRDSTRFNFNTYEKKNSIAMSVGGQEWTIIIEEKKGISSFTDNEINQIQIYQKTYAPIVGFIFGFGIDFIIYNFLKDQLEFETGG